MKKKRESNKTKLESIYCNANNIQVPWNMPKPAEELVALVKEKTIAPCRTLEIGCGTGRHAVFLSQKKFDVTAIDLSESAVIEAKQKATKNKVNCNYLSADFLSYSFEQAECYDFIFDWWVFHHILPKQRIVYADKVQKLLKPGGKYLTVCFAESDPAFEGKGKLRTTPLGTTLYFSNEKEIVELYKGKLKPEDVKTLIHQPTGVPHHSVYALFQKPL